MIILCLFHFGLCCASLFGSLFVHSSLFGHCPWLSAPLHLHSSTGQVCTYSVSISSYICTHPLDRCLRVLHTAFLSHLNQLTSSGYEPCALAGHFRLRHPPTAPSSPHPSTHPSNNLPTLDFAIPTSFGPYLGQFSSYRHAVRLVRFVALELTYPGLRATFRWNLVVLWRF